MRFYSRDRLMLVARHRGYMTQKAVADGIAPIFGLTSATVSNKLSSGNLTKEECEVIGSYFEMSMKEYYDVFMNGLFIEDQEGHYVCHVENPYVHLHPEHVKRKQERSARLTVNPAHEKKMQKTAEDILKELENI